MFEQAVQASEAGRQANATLIPALSGCRSCWTTQMIAAPALGVCEDCGADLTVRGSAEPKPPKVENTSRVAP